MDTNVRNKKILILLFFVPTVGEGGGGVPDTHSNKDNVYTFECK